MAFRQGAEPIEERSQIAMFAGLNETEMTLRQRQRRLARHGAKHRDADRGDSVGDQRPVAFAGDPIEDDAGDAHGRIVDGETAHHGRRRLRLSRHIEHQHHRQAEMRCEIGGRAAPPGAGGGSVEQAHDAFDDQQVCAVDRLGGHGVEQCRRHGPGIQIDARSARGGGMKRRIDVIGPGLGGADHDAAPDERCQYGKRHGGLAGTRTRRRDDQPARGHAALPW